MPSSDIRASPDALLARAKKEGRGHLKIYLGAAPGVGKTFAMLSTGRSAKADGRDVVIGLVETHGRRETEALVTGFEILPRKPVVYRNQIVQEFDIDAALARKPGLILVDEYAHTNVSGSRHPKRWQDIDELLSAGIDVWTTLNIQHLESLNDVVQQITKVRVRETVPDRVFENADEIVLVDFPPDELMKRLAEGKVYVQDTAARAVQNFFKPQNLIALRELALRRTAERIDDDLIESMKAQAIEGPWAAGERILACIGPDKMSATVVRAAKRLADLIDAPWVVAIVERPGTALDPASRKRVDDAFALAESLGGETLTMVGNDIPAEVLRYARAENVTQIVIGRSGAGFLAELFRKSLPHELVRRADDIAIHFITGAQSEGSGWRPGFAFGTSLNPMHFVWVTVGVAIAIGIGRALTAVTPFPNVSMIFLMAVLFPAIRFGVLSALYASVLSFLAYNFFFIEPYYTFTVAEPHELLALAVFLVVAIMTSALAGRVREQARIAAERMRATRRLYDFTRKLSGLAGIDAVAEAAVSEIQASVGRPAVLLMQTGEALALRGSWPPEDELDIASVSAARWTFERGEPAGAQTATLPNVPWYFLPLRIGDKSTGVVGVGANADHNPLDSEAKSLLSTLVEQTASAIERASLSKEMVEVRGAVEAERIRNTLLASISHDFRTPLAAILGSATSVLDYAEKLEPEVQKTLLRQIRDEAVGLDEMVRNLLAITRIDAGALELRKDWVDLGEIVASVAAAAKRRGAQHGIEIRMPEKMPLVMADALLVEQALGNIVQNALSHTPPSSKIVIDGIANELAPALRVTDDGPGIQPDILPHIFEKFVTRLPKESVADKGAGTGLGLAIAKGIVEAHGGSLTAESPVSNGRGARFSFSFPRAQTQ